MTKKNIKNKVVKKVAVKTPAKKMAAVKIDSCKNMNPNHAEALPNVRRIIGQLEGVEKMIEDKRYCPDILTQLKAARSAIVTLESVILEIHIDSCVVNAFDSKNEREKFRKIIELKNLYRKINT